MCLSNILLRLAWHGFLQFIKTETLETVFTKRDKAVKLSFKDVLTNRTQRYQLLDGDRETSLFIDYDGITKTKLINSLKAAAKKAKGGIKKFYIIGNGLNGWHVFTDKMFDNLSDMKEFVVANFKYADANVYKSEQLFRLPFVDKEKEKTNKYTDFYVFTTGTMTKVYPTEKTIEKFVVKQC